MYSVLCDRHDLYVHVFCVCSQFDLVCADSWLVDMYQATLNVGFLVGSIATGYLADRWGHDWLMRVDDEDRRRVAHWEKCVCECATSE